MVAPLISAFITLVALAAFDVCLGFMLLLSLNGYSGKAAEPILYSSAALAISLTIVFAIISGIGAKKLANPFGSIIPASILSVIVSVIAGAVLTTLGVFLFIAVFPQK